jgi:hypothetical protein
MIDQSLIQSILSKFAQIRMVCWNATSWTAIDMTKIASSRDSGIHKAWPVQARGQDEIGGSAWWRSW